MATKKNGQKPKRQGISSGRPRSYGEMYKNDTTRQQVAPVSTTNARAAAPVAATAETANWRSEYDYVLRDLRTLIIVSVILFAVIIIASFFI